MVNSYSYTDVCDTSWPYNTKKLCHKRFRVGNLKRKHYVCYQGISVEVRKDETVESLETTLESCYK